MGKGAYQVLGKVIGPIDSTSSVKILKKSLNDKGEELTSEEKVKYVGLLTILTDIRLVLGNYYNNKLKGSQVTWTC